MKFYCIPSNYYIVILFKLHVIDAIVFPKTVNVTFITNRPLVKILLICFGPMLFSCSSKISVWRYVISEVYILLLQKTL